MTFGLVAATPGLAEAGALDSKTTFLGLEGDDALVTSLADAIRWDLNQRGLDDGNTMSLAELKLTMGCGDEDLACFAQGGQTLGSSQLVFGAVSKKGADYVVELQSLNVETGELNNKIERTVTAEELGDAQLGATASGLIDALYKIEPSVEELPPTETTDGPDELGDASDVKPTKPPPGERALIWGAYSPRPAWKWAGVGVSGVLMVGGLGMAIGATVAISPNGPIRKELITAAENSLQDSKPGNDVDPNSTQDLCELGRAAPDPSKPNEVTNAEVTRVCIKADNMATVATAGWIATGVFAATTVVFTTLLFVHKNDKTAAKLRKHGVGFGGAPMPGNGFTVGGSFRF
ncbi:hypothetical protein DB30_00970 [Enhygromyxa salina]|uniref:Uncharacterized protein n=1 Tax=Enhygromyxa salina TaxID=215803 RepID=A0A0C2CYD9_9BACT|nr:hypothetical protein [Enhygromyxa salina]KIG12852.1 hypothetical protein DB30_00970 [Enhygromyxa salina]